MAEKDAERHPADDSERDTPRTESRTASKKPALRGLPWAIDRAHDWLDRGDACAALSVLGAALAENRQGAPALEIASALGLCAVARRDRGELAVARELFLEARGSLAGSADPEERQALAAILEDEAELELELRAPDSARSRLREALAIHESLGHAIEAETFLALAEAELQAGSAAEALAVLERALLADGEAEDHALAHELRGDALLADDPDRARAAYEEALRSFAALGDGEGIARAHLALARSDEQRDDAEGIASRGRAIAALAIDPALREEALAEIGELLASTGRNDLEGS